jgi:hypothetical protein
MWREIKEKTFGLIQWAEKELTGKSGAEKRAAVVAKLCAIIDIPYIPDWLEGMVEPVLYGWVVDKTCNLLNILTEHAFEALSLSPEQISKAAGLIEITPDGTGILPNEMDLPDNVTEAVFDAGNIDAKLARLYEAYAGK